MLRKYRVPVPSRPPKDAITDSRGRKWVKVEPKEEDEDYFVEWDGDYWYVWFQGSDIECPEEGEVIDFESMKGEVETVRRSYRVMRAVVELTLYKEDNCK